MVSIKRFLSHSIAQPPTQISKSTAGRAAAQDCGWLDGRGARECATEQQGTASSGQGALIFVILVEPFDCLVLFQLKLGALFCSDLEVSVNSGTIVIWLPQCVFTSG